MNARDHVEILLEIKGKLDALTKARKEVGAFGLQLNNLKKTMLAGVGLGAGMTGWGALTLGISSAVAAIKASVAEGIRFNAEMETAQMNMAAVLRAASPATFTTFNQAADASGRILRMLSREADNASTSYTQLIALFTQLTPIMTGRGIPFAQQVSISGNLARAAAAGNLPTEKVRTDLSALLAGRVSAEGRLPQMLGITPAMAARAAASGTTFAMLAERLDSFAESASAAEMTYDRLLGQLTKNLTELKGAATAGVFEEIKQDMAGLVDYTKRQDVREALGILGFVSGGAYRVTKNTVMEYSSRKLGILGEGTEMAIDFMLGNEGRRLFGENLLRRGWSTLVNSALSGQQGEGGDLPDVVGTGTGGETDEERNTRIKSQLKMARDAMRFDYQQKLIDLKTYLAGRQAVVSASVAEGLMDQWSAAEERQEIDQERIKGLMSAESKSRSGMFPMERLSGFVTGGANRGVYSVAGESRILSASVNVQKAMLDELKAMNRKLGGNQQLQ